MISESGRPGTSFWCVFKSVNYVLMIKWRDEVVMWVIVVKNVCVAYNRVVLYVCLSLVHMLFNVVNVL